MIYIILGTRGQFIKMFPIMKYFDKYKIKYCFISTSQHYKINEENRKLLHVRKPDVYLTVKKNDLRNIGELLIWAPKVLWNARKLSIKKTDCVIVHGDTESTLFAFLIGRYFHAKVIHIESGMRSGTFLEPFPEEIIRSFVDNFSDVRFCPFKEDAAHFKGKKNTYITNGNTVFDSVNFALNEKPSMHVRKLMKIKYVVFLVHRKETLFVRQRIEVIMEILKKILEKGLKVIWPVHAITKYELESKGIWQKVEQFKKKYQLETDHFFNYVDFMHLLNNCEFAASDGDGVQEETYFLNKPMLILRKITDSIPGIGENAVISYFDKIIIENFLDNYKKIKRKTEPNKSPSKIIVDYFRKLS